MFPQSHLVAMATNPLFASVNSNRQFCMHESFPKQSDNRNEVSYGGPHRQLSGGVYYQGKHSSNSWAIKENLTVEAMDNAPGKRQARATGTFMEPPDKRRKTKVEQDDELWDEDDDFILTQDQLSNIDQLVASQQVPVPTYASHASTSFQTKTKNASQHAEKIPTKDSIRSVGKGSPKSFSASDVQSRFDRPQGAPFKTVHSSSKFTGTSQPTGFQQQLTPRPATTANARDSPSLPSSHGKTDFSAISNQQFTQVKTHNDALTVEVKKLKVAQVSNLGQIKILQDNLNAEKSARNKLTQDKIRDIEEASKRQSEKEKKMEKELDTLKTKLKFQEQESVELQTTCKRLQKQADSVKDGNLSASQGRSPTRVRCRGESDSPKTPKPGTSGFPNTESFLQKSPVRRQPSPKKLKVALNDKGTQKSTAESINDSTMQLPKRKLVVKTRHSSALGDGSNVVSKLLDPPCVKPDIHSKLTSGLANSVKKLLGPSLLGDRISILPSNIDQNEMVQSSSSSSSARSSKSQHSSVHISTPSESSSEGILNIVSAEHHLLAVQGMQSLLQPCPATDWLESHDHTEAALLLLPLVEDYISFYVNHLQRTARNQDQANSSSDTSLDTMTSSLRSLQLEGPSRVSLEAQVEEALQVLYTLACHSGHVRDAVIRDCELGSPTRMDSEPSGPSEPLAGISKVPATSTPLPDPGEPDKVGVVKTRFLLKKIIHIANPLVSRKMDVTVNVEICVLAFRVLSEVCKACDPSLLNKLQGTNLTTCLVNCLETLPGVPELRFKVATAVIDTVSALTRSPHLIPRLCNESDDCLLLTVYSFYSTAPEVPYPQKTFLHNKLLLLLSSMLSAHTHGVTSVLNADCQCSVEMVKYLIHALHQELSEYQRNCGGKRNWQDQDTERARRADDSFAVLYKGTCLLYSLSLQDAMFTSHSRLAEHMYIQLICGLDKLYQSVQGLWAKEREAIQWLFDIEQEWPDSKLELCDLDGSLDNNNGKHHSEGAC